MISKYKAELLGFLCAEGTYYKYTDRRNEYDKRRKKTYMITRYQEAFDFNNNDTQLLHRFLQLLENVYNYKGNIRCKNSKSPKILIKRKFMVEDLKNIVKIGHLRWRVPKDIINGSKKIKASFLKGLFDGDGSLISIPNPKIVYCSKNIMASKQVIKLLQDLGIKSYLYKVQSRNRNVFYIQIGDIPNIRKFINIIGSNRQDRLYKIKDRADVAEMR